MAKSPTSVSGHALIGQLVAFEATARLGSFRAAADELHLTTGAVAQQVRLMEQKLGMELFQRLARGTRLHPHAHGFFSKVQLALGLINEATRDLTAPYASGAALTLSTTPAFASRWLIPKLAQFNEAEPDVSIMIDASNQQRALHGPHAVDMAIRWGAPPFEGCHAQRLHEGDAIAVCSAPVKKRHRWKTPADLAHDAPLIADSHDNWSKWFTVFDCPGWTSRVQTVSQTSLAIEAAERGLGVALVPPVLVADALANGSLVRALSTRYRLATEAGFYLLTAHEPPASSDLAKVVRWLVQGAV
ncbi:LysR substrate-binding domain-containing protein [Pseudomonas sp. dw_358]|uniref:LysR substrate-binding domain-containing protein n=1 Tax=Pseudomonas sp. dw_358 TaxID=2720083 RepID=UPI001BD5FB22|nr:LysR substrate-binding domain-containing protein [Pseudomonas sp. dw_358]